MSNGEVEKDDVSGNDLLSLLIRANLASDMPVNMRMSDAEILSRAYSIYLPRILYEGTIK